MPGTNEHIDFYILKSAGDVAAHRFACRLIEKIYKQGNRAFVLLDTLPEAPQTGLTRVRACGRTAS